MPKTYAHAATFLAKFTGLEVSHGSIHRWAKEEGECLDGQKAQRLELVAHYHAPDVGFLANKQPFSQCSNSRTAGEFSPRLQLIEFSAFLSAPYERFPIPRITPFRNEACKSPRS